MNNNGQDKIYQIVNDQIIALLEKELIPWHKPWKSQGVPVNFKGNSYRGINSFILNCSQIANSYKSNRWASMKQINELNGSVKAGEKSQIVIYWNWIELEDKQTGKTEKKPFLKYYRVFNLDQTTIKIEAPTVISLKEFNPIEEAEKIITAYKNKPTINHVLGDSAHYNPVKDIVVMPTKEQFKADSFYYSTLFHELVHSTGHETRLNRHSEIKDHYFGSVDYGKEELIAEMGNAFLCGIAKINQDEIENSAAYIQNWLKAIKQDSKLLVQSAAKAQKASDYILGVTYND
ncbi:MAG: DUF1738 domain-containing protein [Desulfobacterales bacterium]|nr:DUF1738 domain-containing protein [Desulfobacterales bacterium]